MRKIFLNIVFLSVGLLLIGSALNMESAKSLNHSIKLQFVTYNGYGNNLYIDNIMIGTRPRLDMALTSINNIPSDTFFLPGTVELKILPEITVSNLGTESFSDTIVVNLNIEPLNITDTAFFVGLNAGSTRLVTFDSVTLPANVLLDIKTYITSKQDSLKQNDTLAQSTVLLQGFARKILAEEFTSYTSPSCGAQNHFLDSFIAVKSDSMCAIKYHVGFPSPGIDSFYFSDSLSVNARRNYYFNQSVPQTVFDGINRIALPYLIDTNFSIPYISRMSFGSPLELNMKDSSVTADSVVTTVNVSVIYPLLDGFFKLRLAVVETYVIDSVAPGASGETVFYDVFRKMLPDSNGIVLNLLPGSYQYKFGFSKKQDWVDSLIYTVAFVQNDANREIINSAKSLNINSSYIRIKRNFINVLSNRPDIDPRRPFDFYSGRRFSRTIKGDTSSVFNFENFEGLFPPPGWIITNPDGWLTFEKAKGVNGISLNGNNSVRVNFYEYYNIGQKDTLESVAFDSVKATDTLYFDYSYARYLSAYVDSLYVNISTDGGTTYTNIFAKGGQPLSTAQATTLPFSPVSSSQWKTFSYPLSQILPPENPLTVAPKDYELSQNYPNPFNPVTTITVKLPFDVDAELIVYDVTGRQVAKLLNGKQKAGIINVKFDASGLSSGIYFYRLIAGEFKDVKKMVFVR